MSCWMHITLLHTTQRANEIQPNNEYGKHTYKHNIYKNHNITHSLRPPNVCIWFCVVSLCIVMFSLSLIWYRMMCYLWQNCSLHYISFHFILLLSFCWNASGIVVCFVVFVFSLSVFFWWCDIYNLGSLFLDGWFRVDI